MRTYGYKGLVIGQDWKEISASVVAQRGLVNMYQEGSSVKIFQILTKDEAFHYAAANNDLRLLSLLQLSGVGGDPEAAARQRAILEDKKRREAVTTSNSTAELLQSLEADLTAKESDEAITEAEETQAPPPAPTPRRRKKATKTSAEQE
jgi:hypothetical protein